MCIELVASERHGRYLERDEADASEFSCLWKRNWDIYTQENHLFGIPGGGVVLV